MNHRDFFTSAPVVGERVTGVSAGPGYRSEWQGVYDGIRPDEGTDMHMFRDGAINGHPDRLFGIPVRRTVPAPGEYDRWVQEIAQMILDDIDEGVVPGTVREFHELHSYLDANDYGLTTGVPWGADVATTADPAGVGLMADVENAAMRLVNERRGV